ncbi:MAG: TlpA family protein disulfide reductase [Haloechinothrix sp.]
MTGLWVLLGTLVLGLVAGLVLRSREGRVRPANVDHSGRADGELPQAIVAELSADAEVTLVQISTTFCAPCRHAHARLSALAERTEGLRHADLDVTHRPEIAYRLGVMRTPTTIAFDPRGTELLRIGGVPDSTTLLDALRAHLPAAAPRE